MSNPDEMPRRQTHFKRLIVCCDGSWMDSLGAKGAEPQSNVTRLARVVRRTCYDGTHQIVWYDAGVGTGMLKADQLTGGGLGMGLAQNVREAYNFICTNYVDGDDIILTGFSRGAFTARSVADMIATVGLLRPLGLDHFYRIFDDYKNLSSPIRMAGEFLCPEGVLKPWDLTRGEAKAKWASERKKAYKDWLVANDYTREYQAQVDAGGKAKRILVKAIGVWDTVGSLGIPPISILGLQGSAVQWKFANTRISEHVEYAFQALALDEPRDAYKPSLWEKAPENKVTYLKQVWFPGSHGDCGGGNHDQQMANITLAWMADQLSSFCGVEFNNDRLTEVFLEGLSYSTVHPFPAVTPRAVERLIPSFLPSIFSTPEKVKGPMPWANDPIYRFGTKPTARDSATCNGDSCRRKRHPPGTPKKQPQDTRWADVLYARPWALGQIHFPSRIQALIGSGFRHPGRYRQADPDTNKETDRPLTGTNERVHSSVRVRLSCGGLSMDDEGKWRCEPLVGAAGDPKAEKAMWRIERGSGIDKKERADFRVRELDTPGYPADELYDVQEGDGNFVWVFNPSMVLSKGTPLQLPTVPVLPEEPLSGYWERHLLWLTNNNVDVWRFAEKNLPV
ncbi:hypothetical protein MGG_07522 [Pyricularia oryzae 70-15]|uniref:T6SS Phospholipase effector Tle1-like catalytic domain-containing protein n=3 Tax=Pyricularia oryzae TaxID=318829 RepID=G4N1Q6_PYRO7|nr:uncharacterized protein MGG_07522 [Pyricularia oryzae 70-15]EHA51628.1 hypothetical protein MGG_07522 [Pyricularia oryzae 70-15]KAI7926811.1 hypothetical protein M9X92_002550 [Pyricularia oryzae]KAI7928359.1 hypothetical protein M0657_002758 [Pyricularia oryzae]